MTFNRIAIFGHRGWVGRACLRSLTAAGAPVRVLHRVGSDVSNLPAGAGITTAEVDLDDPETLIPALKDIDIAISFAAREIVPKQKAFVEAIPSTDVKLFVPSDLGFNVDAQGLQILANKSKHDVEQAAKAVGVPTTKVWVGCFTESTLAFPILGIDQAGNRMIVTGDSLNQQLNLCTRDYVAAAYASIFARTPPEQLQGRAIGISELRATGQEIAAALKEKHGKEPELREHTLEKVDDEITRAVAGNSPLALGWHCRKAWATGDLRRGIGQDIWEFEYQKATLQELLLGEKLKPYKDMPPHVEHLFYGIFDK